jgi:hypothetical protein
MTLRWKNHPLERSLTVSLIVTKKFLLPTILWAIGGYGWDKKVERGLVLYIELRTFG